MKLTHNTEVIDVKSRLPVIPLRDVVVFPYMIYPLLVGREFTVKALQEAMMEDKQVLLIAQRSSSIDNPDVDDMFELGLVARVLQVMKMPNGTLKVLVEGLVRARLVDLKRHAGYLYAKVHVLPRDHEANDRETEALARAVSEQFAEYVRLNRRIPDEVLVSVASIERHHQLADTISAHLLHKIETKQRLLEAVSIKDQLHVLSEVLQEEIEILKKRTGIETPQYKIEVEIGDSVKIIDGPFKDFDGKVSEIDEERGKIKILVNMFGRDTPVELDSLQAKKL